MAPPDLMPFSGDWTSYVESVFARYHADFVENTVHIWGRPVKIRWNPATFGKPFNFWHVVSEGKDENERLPDIERCSRIAWIAWVIECCDKELDCVSWWLTERSTSRGSSTRLVLWAHAEEYVVILEPRDGFAFLVSAYPVRGRVSHKLAKEYAAFTASPRNIPYWEP